MTGGMAMPTIHEEVKTYTLKTPEKATKVVASIAETLEESEEETVHAMLTPVETSLELESEGEGMLIFHVVNKLHHVLLFPYS